MKDCTSLKFHTDYIIRNIHFRFEFVHLKVVISSSPPGTRTVSENCDAVSDAASHSLGGPMVTYVTWDAFRYGKDWSGFTFIGIT